MKNEVEAAASEGARDHLSGHRLVILVVIVITVALMMLAVSLKLYYTSGAAQIDLSRRGYESVREKAFRDEDVPALLSNGVIDREVLSRFQRDFLLQLDEVRKIDDFGKDFVSNDELGISAQ